MTLIDRLEARQADITTLAVDAIVNAANTSLLGGGGVDGAIHRAAGPELLAECREVGGCPTGEARITKGHRLPAAHVIHTVGPVYRGQPRDCRLLADCYTNSLILSREHGIRSLAFPAVSCGVFGYPVADACKIALDTCAAFMHIHEMPVKVIFVLFSSQYRDIYTRYLSSCLG